MSMVRVYNTETLCMICLNNLPHLPLLNHSLSEDMDHMFSGAKSFDGNVNGWNTSSVTNMANVFSFARSFSGDVSSKQKNKL